MNSKKLSPSIYALLFSGMGFMLLLVMVIFERGAFNMLFDINAESDSDASNVFKAISMVIHVMPFVLGPFILGTFVFGLIQAKRSGWAIFPIVILVSFSLPIIWNITFADTVGVVETLKNTIGNDSIIEMRKAAQGVMRQHHIGIIGFGVFLVGQISYITNLLRS